ncbi:MAG: Gfo/Idh/MocA family oxidoreductase [Acidobacteriota bacterium]
MAVGLVGAGAWGRNHLRVWSQLGELVGVCETDPRRAALLGQEFPGVQITPVLHGLLSDARVQGLVIATPAETHFRLAKEGLLAGKDIFVEKPLALTVQEGEELVDLARDKGRVLMVGHVLQYHPAVLKLRDMIRNGDFGKINYVYSNRLNFGKIRTEENILWSFAPHDISVMLMLLDEMPIRVASQGGNYLHRTIADVTVSSFQFKSGVNAHIFVSWLHPFKEQKLVVVGEKGMAVFDDVSPHRKLLVYPHRINWVNRVPVSEKAEATQVDFEAKEPLREECLHFLECMKTRTPPRTDGAEGLRVLQMLTACQNSLEMGGNGIDIPQLIQPASQPDYFLHPSSTVDHPCEIGSGTRIWHYSHIMQDCRIGRNCNIGQNVVVSPGCVLGENVKVQNNVSIYTGVICEDDVFLGPSMVFTNVTNPRSHIVRRGEYKTTLVKRGASIGANATIVCGRTIGRYAFIGAGAVVTRDVADYALVMGNPARQVGWMCQCGVRLRFADNATQARCDSCHAAYELNHNQVRPLDLPLTALEST